MYWEGTLVSFQALWRQNTPVWPRLNPKSPCLGMGAHCDGKKASPVTFCTPVAASLSKHCTWLASLSSSDHHGTCSFTLLVPCTVLWEVACRDSQLITCCPTSQDFIWNLYPHLSKACITWTMPKWSSWACLHPGHTGLGVSSQLNLENDSVGIPEQYRHSGDIREYTQGQ